MKNEPVGNYFEYKCGYRFLEPHNFFDIFLPVRNKREKEKPVVEP